MCKAEPDIWICRNNDTYEYIAVYVDNLTLAMKDLSVFVELLKTKHGFHFKGTGPLAFHLGADFYHDTTGILSMAPRKYVERLINNYVQVLVKNCAQMFTHLLRKVITLSWITLNSWMKKE